MNSTLNRQICDLNSQNLTRIRLQDTVFYISGERFTLLTDMSARSNSEASPFEKRLLHRLQEHEGAIVHCTVDPKEKILATCSTDAKIILWTIATGEVLRTLTGGHTGEVTSCSFCSVGPILASSSRDKKVILWNYETGKRASRLGKFSAVLLFRYNDHIFISVCFNTDTLA